MVVPAIGPGLPRDGATPGWSRRLPSLEDECPANVQALIYELPASISGAVPASRPEFGRLHADRPDVDRPFGDLSPGRDAI